MRKLTLATVSAALLTISIQLAEIHEDTNYLVEAAATERDYVRAADSCIHPITGEVLEDYPEDTFRAHDGLCVHIEEIGG